MKTALILTAILMFMTITPACTGSVEIDRAEVDCIGLMEDPDPNYVYKPHVSNIILGTLFVGLIAPAAVVLLDRISCPVSRKYEDINK